MANPTTSKKSIDTREYEVVCRLLCALRTRAKLSQRALAERLGRPQSFVGDVELAARRLDALQLRSWAEACGSTFTDFARRLDEALELMPAETPAPAKKAPNKRATKKNATPG